MRWGNTLYRASWKIQGKKIRCRGRGTGKVCLYRVVFFANYNMKKNGNKIFLASFVILYYHYYYFFISVFLYYHYYYYFLQWVVTKLKLPDLTGTR